MLILLKLNTKNNKNYKFFRFIAFMSLSSTLPSPSVTIHCSFNISRFYVVGKIYICKVTKDPNINVTSIIRSINGTHQFRKSNNDVTGFSAISKTMFYFPLNMTKIFKNIKFINILSCKMRKIRQHDLMEFPNLKYLNLGGNSIQNPTKKSVRV